MIFLQRNVEGFAFRVTLIIAIFISSFSASAQRDGGPKRQGGAFPEITGRVYGKILDTLSSIPLEYAVVRVVDENNKLINGALAERNGDFSIDKVPVGKAVYLEVAMIGYVKKKSAIQLTPGQPPVEKDLGNIKLRPVVEDALIIKDENGFRKEFDKSIYEVDKNAINAGGTAEDVLRNIPIVQWIRMEM